MAPENHDPLAGISEHERKVMARLLRTPHEQQKAAPKPKSKRAEAQRRRREAERRQPSHQATCGD